MSSISAIASTIINMDELNGGKNIKLKTKYPVLKTRYKKVENWWNSLKWIEKVEVGSIAVHYHLMTPSYRFKCYDEDMFDDLSKSQKKIVKTVFNKKNDMWYMFDFVSMLKL
jgi:hypothetical protein